MLPVLLGVLPLLLLPAQDDPRLERAVTLDDHFPFAPPADRASWEARRDAVRRQVLVAAGLWPLPSRTPMQAVVHGRVERDGYTVEKAYFQALAGFYVTGNLYRPAGEGPFAGVLCPHGHWENGRFSERPEDEVRAQIARGEEAHLANGRYHLQARCAQLARMGCVVFHYDMIGYGDSRQLDHREAFGTVQDELWSLSQFGLQTWSSIRALDFLESLPDVDPARIGVTGASGGGTQTFVLCAVDDRPAVAFPAVMVSTRMQGGCVCENASHLRVRTGNVELAALFAPKPLALTGANDWTIDIERDGLPELKQVWGMYRAEDDVEAWCYPSFEHNYNLVSRLRMYAWFNEHLELGYTEPIVERPIEPIEPGELSAFDADHPPPPALDSAGLRATWREAVRAPEGAALRAALQVLVHAAPSFSEELDVLDLNSLLPGGLELGERALRVGAGERGGAVRILEWIPDDWDGNVVVEEGRWEPPVRLGRRAVLHAITLLAPPSGAVRTLPVDAGRHGRFVGYTFGYNPTLLAHRVRDLLTAVAYARSLEGARSIALASRGEAGTRVLLTAALAGDVDRVAVDWPGDFDRVESFDDPDFLPGALRAGGLAAFAGLCAPAELLLIGCDEVPPATAAAYAAAGCPDAVRAVLTIAPADLAEWLGRP